ncbi:acyltransferase family protein [Winogradskyella aurantia]|uniref:Acyltransferase 3 domain-containing protein n=1 Tax=Winogradskyella aurantia TaxID=1915063 RepID=A0A265UXJ7_9FLAO|nr:acyltransferase family protein [Winogradskyella aurantia]OZV70016.1 hypothetical protein CA834_05200 [Winogradskyella aurantia]
MKSIPHKTERLHALDSLRAIMMMLGVVLHSVITYTGGEPQGAWLIRDLNNFNPDLGWIGSIIHVFRMPIFMLVAGFFAALLFYERGKRQMFKNRMQRLTWPFVVFVIILFVPVVGGMQYTLNVFEGNTDAFAIAAERFPNLASFIPNKTMHLWFLYYLIMFSVVSFFLGSLFKTLPKTSGTINKYYFEIFKRPIVRLVIFTALTVLILVFMDRTWVNTSTSFVPELGTFFFYFYFYMVGWLLFKAKSLLNTFKRYDWQFTLLGTAIFTWYFFADTSGLSLYLIMVIRCLCCWLLIFGITGLFIRFGSHHSARMRYVSDSSYWVYLFHLPLTIIIPALIADWDIAAGFKFLIVTTTTSIICFATYHYFVRTTFIGKFLNGRTYPRKISEIRKAYLAQQPQLQLDK